MISPIIPSNERKRQKAVEKYQLLDTIPEERYDNITSIISQICDTPIALITMLDNNRNFLKSHHGIPFNESPRDISFCGHAINQEDSLMIVEDARKDPRFHDNPLVVEKGVVFYAGASLVNPEGHKLGTICVYDTKPRKLENEQKKALKQLAKQVVMLFEQRIKNEELLQLKESLQRKNESLEKFAEIVSHDLKSPVNNIISLTNLLKNENPYLSEDSLMYIDYLQKSSFSLKSYIDGVLNFHKSDSLLGLSTLTFSIEEMLEECTQIINGNHEANIDVNTSVKNITANKPALIQVFINLIGNAIKYNDKDTIFIQIGCREDEEFYHFEIKDNGKGIPKESLSKIFGLFERVGGEDRYGNQGNGIGLATSHKIITTLGGEISVSSTLGKGSVFNFTVEKE